MLQNDSLLPTIAEMRRAEEKTTTVTFESDAELFEHIFENGEYHEDEVDWDLVASRLSKSDIAKLVPGAIRPFINTGCDSENLLVIMSYYDALSAWLNRQIPDINHLTEALNGMCSVAGKIIKKADPRCKAWLKEGMQMLCLIHLAVDYHLGVRSFNTQQAYSFERDQLE